MDEREARLRGELAAAGRRLLEAGLAARTWGNLSARLSADEFLITPSGMDYERLRPEDMVLVSAGTLKSRGPHRPSSEKTLHAELYRLRPGIGFILHTHQLAASCAGVRREALTGLQSPVLGSRVPCAAYALPSTKKLARSVRDAAASCPASPAVLLPNHGAVVFGADAEEAFRAAEELERVCAARLAPPPERPAPRELGSSVRTDLRFRLTVGGEGRLYDLDEGELPFPANLHAALYRSTGAGYLLPEQGAAAVCASASGPFVRPYLDDLAQIAGASLRCVDPEARDVSRAIRGRSAVYVKGLGALCAGRTPQDAEDVRTVLRKDAAARLYAGRGGFPVRPADAALQRLIYVKSYAARKDAGGPEC